VRHQLKKLLPPRRRGPSALVSSLHVAGLAFCYPVQFNNGVTVVKAHCPRKKLVHHMSIGTKTSISPILLDIY